MLLTNANKLTMTSREIAELTGKRHDNVKRTIENLIVAGVITLPQIEETSFIDSIGKRQTMNVYVFTEDKGKRDSIVVVAQLSPEFTATIVDRWQELELQLQGSLAPKSFADALQLAADQQREIERQAKSIENLEPYALLGCAVIADAKTFSLTEAFKHLEIDTKMGFQILCKAGWIFKKKQYDSLKDAVWQPCKSKMEAGWLVFKQRPDKYGKYRAQTLVTPAGLKALRSFFEIGPQLMGQS